MKNKQPQITINLTANTEKTTPEELKKFYDVLNQQQQKQNEKPKRKQPLYALNEDIEKVHARYDELFKQVRNSLNLSEKQIEIECDTLSLKYYFELEELNKERKVNYNKRQAEIKAHADEETPIRRGWWWRLIFQPLTNRAQDIIEERAALEAEEKFAPIEKELDELADKLYAGTGKRLSKRKRKRLMNKYLKLKRKLIGSATAPPTDNVQSETPASTAAPAPPLPSPTSETAEPVRDAVHPNNNDDEITDDNVTEPPEPPARKPRKPKQTGS